MSEHKDTAGTSYVSPDGKPAGHGTTVIIGGPHGGQPGVMVGTEAVPLKSSK